MNIIYIIEQDIFYFPKIFPILFAALAALAAAANDAFRPAFGSSLTLKPFLKLSVY